MTTSMSYRRWRRIAIPAATGNAVKAMPSTAIRHCTFSSQMNHDPMTGTMIATIDLRALRAALTPAVCGDAEGRGGPSRWREW